MQRSVVRIFAFGVVTGLVLTVLSLGGVGLIVLRGGVTVPVSRERFIDQLTTEVGIAMQSAMPKMLVQAREQMPLTVKEQVRSGLGEMSLEIANYQIRLPQAVVSRIDGYLQSTVTAAFEELLRGLETSAGVVFTEDQLRPQVAHWANSLDGKSLAVEVAPQIRLPVTIRLR